MNMRETMNMREKVVDLEITIHVETDRALLISTDGNYRTAKWVPKAAIELDGRTITMPERMAIDKGLI